MTELQAQAAKLRALRDAANETCKGSDREAYFAYLKETQADCADADLIEENARLRLQLAQLQTELRSTARRLLTLQQTQRFQR